MNQQLVTLEEVPSDDEPEIIEIFDIDDEKEEEIEIIKANNTTTKFDKNKDVVEIIPAPTTSLKSCKFFYMHFNNICFIGKF